MIAYFRSAANYYNPKGLGPACDLSACKQTMLAYSADTTECGVMADCTQAAKDLITSTGGVECTRASLSDIYDFPLTFLPIPV